LLALALCLRLTAFLILPAPDLDTSATEAYWGGANRLLHGVGFSDTSYPVFAPPLYAIFISLCLTLFGDSQVPVKIVQACVDAAMTIILYLIGREVFDARTGLLSAGIWAVYPFPIYLALTIASEPLFTLLLGIFVLLTIYAICSQRSRYYCAAGILLGLATLTRATTQFLPLMFPLMILPFPRQGKAVLVNYTVFCLSFSLVILPWTMRNYVVLRDFIPVATAGGAVLLEGSSETLFTAAGRVKELPTYFESLRVKGIVRPPSGSKPSEEERFLIRAGIENYKSRLHNDARGFVLFLLSKVLRLWYMTASGRNQGVILAVNLLIYLFALAGLVLAWIRERSMAWVLASMLVYFVAIHCLTVPLYRYMVPTMPYVIGFASFGIIVILEQLVHSS